MKTRFRKPTVAAGVFLCIFFFITTASAVTAPQGSTQKGPLEVQAPHPSLQVKEPDYNFGQVQEGTEVEHEFTVSNTGNAVLNIERVRVS